MLLLRLYNCVEDKKETYCKPRIRSKDAEKRGREKKAGKKVKQKQPPDFPTKLQGTGTIQLYKISRTKNQTSCECVIWRNSGYKCIRFLPTRSSRNSNSQFSSAPQSPETQTPKSTNTTNQNLGKSTQAQERLAYSHVLHTGRSLKRQATVKQMNEDGLRQIKE